MLVGALVTLKKPLAICTLGNKQPIMSETHGRKLSTIAKQDPYLYKLQPNRGPHIQATNKQVHLIDGRCKLAGTSLCQLLCMPRRCCPHNAAEAIPGGQ